MAMTSKASDGQRFWLSANEAVVQLDLGRARVGLAARAAAQFDQRVRLLGAGGEDAARPVVLERAADEADAVGDERRGERVARAAVHGDAVEGERVRRRAVDQAAAGETVGGVGAAHRAAPGVGGGNGSKSRGCACRASTTSQAWQPPGVVPELAVHSPAGLSRR